MIDYPMTSAQGDDDPAGDRATLHTLPGRDSGTGTRARRPGAHMHADGSRHGRPDADHWPDAAWAAADADSTPAAGLTLRQLGLLLTARWRAGLLITFMVLLLVLGALWLWPRTYTATTALMVNYQVTDPLNGKALPVGQLSSFIATQVELMRTPDLLLTVVDRLQLAQDRHFTAGYTPGHGTLREWTAGALARQVAVYPSQLGSQLIYISTATYDSALAASLSNTVAEVYREDVARRSSGLPGQRARQNATEVAQLKERLEQARLADVNFQQEHGLLGDGGRNDVEGLALANLQGRLLEAQHQRRAAEAHPASEAANSDQALASPLLQTARTQLAAREAALAQMARSYGSAYPPLHELQQQVDDLRRSLASMTQSYAANTQATLHGARTLEAQIEAALQAQRGRVDAQARLREQALRYQLEFTAAQDAYKRALDGSAQINLEASSQPYTNVEVVSRATAPVNASAPKLLSSLLFGVIAALVLGLGLPLGWELLHRRVRCADDLQHTLGLTVLAEIPDTGRLA